MDERGAALLEFAIALPLLVLFVVGIYDFSGAFNQKLKMDQAAQGGAIIAGTQPTSDIASSNGNPASLQAVVAAVFNSLAGSGVLRNANQGACVVTGPMSADQSSARRAMVATMHTKPASPIPQAKRTARRSQLAVI